MSESAHPRSLVIDAHAHLVDRRLHGDRWWCGYAEILKMRGVHDGDLETVRDTMLREMEAASDRDRLIALMDVAGIDVMVLSPIDYGVRLGDGETSIADHNRRFAEYAAGRPDRFVSFVGIDPRRGVSGLELVERAISEWGSIGMKLHPAAGFYPNDPICRPFYEKAVELDVPILMHTGIEPRPLLGKYGQPIHLDDVLADFPTLRLMAAHMASVAGAAHWREELLTIATFNTNLYMDVSAMQPLARTNPDGFRRILREAIDRVGAHRIAFGSDHPYLESAMTIDRWVQFLREPAGSGEVDFTALEIESLLGGTAREWLGERFASSLGRASTEGVLHAI